MANDQHRQALTEWEGDVASLIAEMKRRAGATTDHELAGFMKGAQSTVSHWRKRGAIPEAAILRFERALEAPRDTEFARSLAARTIALRLPELNHQRLKDKGIEAGRRLSHGVISLSFNAIVAEIAGHMKRFQDETGLSLEELTAALIEDEKFLNGVLEWVGNSSAADMVSREVAATTRNNRHSGGS